MTVGASLLIDAAPIHQETVTVTAVTATTFTAKFTNRIRPISPSARQPRQTPSAPTASLHNAGTLTLTAAADWIAERRNSNQHNNHQRHGELRRHLPQ